MTCDLATRVKEVNPRNRATREKIDDAISVYVREIRLPGIDYAGVKTTFVTFKRLQDIIAQLEQNGRGKIRVLAEIELFLRLSNTDLLSSIETSTFRLSVNAEATSLRAVASTEKDWAKAWERGIKPIRETALQSMRRDMWKTDETLTEDSYSFQAGMVLLASELVGPYVERIATFVDYPLALVQVIRG